MWANALASSLQMCFIGVEVKALSVLIPSAVSGASPLHFFEIIPKQALPNLIHHVAFLRSSRLFLNLFPRRRLSALFSPHAESVFLRARIGKDRIPRDRTRIRFTLITFKSAQFPLKT